MNREFRNLSRLQPFYISILKKLGSTAFARARWRDNAFRACAFCPFRKDVEKVFLLALGIKHHEMLEEPMLKRIRLALTFLL